jgi:hypothetical protein
MPSLALADTELKDRMAPRERGSICDFMLVRSA